jgi:hypothetical protein
VRLRIEEDFRVHDSLRVSFAQVGLGQLMKVISVAQYGGAVIIDVEKCLQVCETIGPAQFLHRGMRQNYAVLLCKPKCELRFERALDVHMQFRLGKPNDVFLCGLHLKNPIDVNRPIARRL